jgi:hypothetical protein
MSPPYSFIYTALPLTQRDYSTGTFLLLSPLITAYIVVLDLRNFNGLLLFKLKKKGTQLITVAARAKE